MKSIYASKLYRASTRKDRIQAALIAPGNLALVQQLADSLDDEYQTPKNLGLDSKPEEQDTQSKSDNLISDEEINPETDLVTMDDLANSLKSGAKPHPSSSHSDASPSSEPKEHEDKPETDTSELIPDSLMTEEEPAKKVTKIEKKEEPAEASTKITATTVSDLNILKATLNDREDLAGVARIAEKDNEIWIYYKDEVNLNNIMTDVIEFLMNTKDYESFEFNRLARSDNAIVFLHNKETFQYPENEINDIAE